jgi:glycosyltransferase involved in cell wall biosynthesis
VAPAVTGLVEVSDRPLRLLMVSHYFEERRGGIEIVAGTLARELSAAGFEVTWLAAGGTGGDGSDAGAVRRRGLAASGVAEALLKIPYPILMPSAWRTISQEAERSDVILAHDALYLTSIAARRAARAHRKPLLVVQHIGLVPYRNRMLRSLMERANRSIAAPLLRSADQVVFISQIVSRYFAGIGWHRPPVLIFNGVDTAIFSPAADAAAVELARAALGLPPRAPVALFVGRFVEKKGLTVLEHLARARADVMFAFAGRGPLDPENWRLANVRVYRSLSGRSLARLYQVSDLLLLPSVGEGFPLVVQEALACGLPILCGADTAEADPRAAPYLRGIEVDLAQPETTALRYRDAMLHLREHPQTDADRRQRCEFARTSYSWQVSSAAYAQLLRSLHTRS